MATVNSIRGIVHGKRIELATDPGFSDGEQVEVTIRAAPDAKSVGAGLQRSAGALADHWRDEDDEILMEIEKDRERSADRPLPS